MPAYRTNSHQPYPAANQPAQAFELADLLRLVRARQSLILRIAVCVVVLAVITVLALPNVYSTSATVVLEQRKNSITDQASVITPLTVDAAMLQNQIQILSSRDLAAQVITTLKLYDDPEFNPARSGNGISRIVAALHPRTWFTASKPVTMDSQQRLRDEVITNFLDHLSVGAEGLSTTLSITFTSQDPIKAARIANALADNYVVNQVVTKVGAAQSTAAWLTERVHDLSQQIQIEEEAIQRYKTENKLADTNTGMGGLSPLVDQQIAAINTQLLTAKTSLAEKEAIFNRVDSLVKAGNVGDVSTVVSSPLISQLRTQQADLISKGADLSTRYGPLHPSVQAIETQKRELDSKIAQEAIRAASMASNDVVVARAQVAALQGALSAAESKAGSQNMARVKLKALEANEASTRAMYETFVSRLRGVQNQDAIQNAEARVISRAPIPDSPAAPKRTLIVAASLPAGLLLGLLVALMLERFGYAAAEPRQHYAPNLAAPAFTSASMRGAFSPPPVQSTYSGPPVIADIPNASAPGAADYIIDWPQSAFSHAVAGLVGRLSSGQTQFIAVTTIEPSFGGSILAVALARAASAMGRKVLLIEAGGHANAARAMRLAPPAGLADILLNRISFAAALTKDPRSNAFLIGNAHAPRDTASMFVSQQMAGLIQYLRGACDLVIIDAGAILGGSAATISRQADATLVVASPDALRRPTVTQALSLVGQSPATGIVVTR